MPPAPLRTDEWSMPDGPARCCSSNDTEGANFSGKMTSGCDLVPTVLLSNASERHDDDRLDGIEIGRGSRAAERTRRDMPERAGIEYESPPFIDTGCQAAPLRPEARRVPTLSERGDDNE